MIAIISDVHGNFFALKEVLKKIDEFNIKEIYCLGDVVGYYSQVNECCDELRQRNAKCVMGNHDWYMASNTFCPRSKSANDCLAYQRKIITNENLEWIKSFPVVRVFDGISMVHGSWDNPIDDYLEPSYEYFNKIEGNVFFSGHKHIQRLDMYKNKIYCNPGSVGQPRDNDNRAAFATYKEGTVNLYRLNYNIDNTADLMKKAGFSDYYYGCLYNGNKTLCNMPAEDKIEI